MASLGGGDRCSGSICDSTALRPELLQTPSHPQRRGGAAGCKMNSLVSRQERGSGLISWRRPCSPASAERQRSFAIRRRRTSIGAKAAYPRSRPIRASECKCRHQHSAACHARRAQQVWLHAVPFRLSPSRLAPRRPAAGRPNCTPGLQLLQRGAVPSRARAQGASPWPEGPIALNRGLEVGEHHALRPLALVDGAALAPRRPRGPARVLGRPGRPISTPNE